VQRKNWATHVSLLVVQIAFASGAVEGKLAMAVHGVEPFALGMARMAGCAIFFQIAVRAAGALSPTTWRDQAKLIGLSVLGIVINQTLFLMGLKLTSAFSAALLGVTIPVFTAALAIATRQERPRWRTGAGLAIAIAGVLWLIGVKEVDRGAVLVALNCFAYSLYIVLGRSVIQRLGAMTVMTWVFTWGAIMFAPVGIAPLVRGFGAWSPAAWGLVAFVVVVPTALAYTLNAWALGRSTASVVTVYVYLQPLLAAIISYFQLGAGLSGRMIVAALLIFVGVTIVSSRAPTRAA
jgi:drug/metabolite transporter (DMT)-like permease